jgi:hypothetical protein
MRDRRQVRRFCFAGAERAWLGSVRAGRAIEYLVSDSRSGQLMRLEAHRDYQSINPAGMSSTEMTLVVGVVEDDTATKFAGAARGSKAGVQLVFNSSRPMCRAGAALQRVGLPGRSHYFCNVMAVSDPAYPVITGFSKSATLELLEKLKSTKQNHSFAISWAKVSRFRITRTVLPSTSTSAARALEL